MRWIQVGVIALAMGQRPSSLHGQTRLDSLLRFPPGSSIASLAHDFRRAHSPITNNVVGAWRATRQVVTERFMTGREGPDRISLDPTLLKFRLATHNELEAQYAQERWEVVRRNGSGDLVVESDEGGDAGAAFYSCRAIGATRLVCFDLDHIGAGAGAAVAFERVSRQPPI